MDYDQIKELIKTQNNSQGIDIAGIVRIILKRKIFIILSFVLVLSAGYIYLKTAARIYESTVLLKKEGDNKNNSERDDPYLRLISLRSQDDITTEMALIKTKSVLDRVVKKLNLDLLIEKVVTPGGKTEEIYRSLPEYNLLDDNRNSLMPQILSFQTDSLDNSISLVLTKDNAGHFLLYKTENNKNSIIGVFPDNNPVEIKTTNFTISIYWPEVQKG